MNFDTAFDLLIGHEGGYSNHPSDRGGETMWGVTRRVALKNGYTGDMHVFPRERAKAIYRKDYWDAIQADRIPQAARYAVFDAAVNSGVSRSIQWLQKCVDVGETGELDQLSLASVESADGLKLAVQFTADRLDFLTSLPTWGAFGRGWARRIAGVLQTSLEQS